MTTSPRAVGSMTTRTKMTMIARVVVAATPTIIEVR
jgi:hypothetical protein